LFAQDVQRLHDSGRLVVLAAGNAGQQMYADTFTPDASGVHRLGSKPLEIPVPGDYEFWLYWDASAHPTADFRLVATLPNGNTGQSGAIADHGHLPGDASGSLVPGLQVIATAPKGSTLRVVGTNATAVEFELLFRKVGDVYRPLGRKFGDPN